MIEELLKKLAHSLDNNNVRYMVIGGQAVLLYGTPRLTRDIDITVGLDTDKYNVMEKVCRESNLKILPEKPEDFAQETNVLPAAEPETNIRVDFIFSFTDYEAQAIARAKNVLMHDYPVKYASCEDLIIHKMIAARAVDLEDVKNIITKSKNSIDHKYIERWLAEFGKIPEHQEILEKFHSIWLETI